MPLSMIHYWFIVPPPDREKDAQRGTERYWGCENEGNAKRKWKILLMFLSCLFAAAVVTQSSAELSCLLKDRTEWESTNRTGEKESFVLGWKQNCLESQTTSRDSHESLPLTAHSFQGRLLMCTTQMNYWVCELRHWAVHYCLLGNILTRLKIKSDAHLSVSPFKFLDKTVMRSR